MGPQEFAENLVLDFEGISVLKGVKFAEFVDEKGRIRYHLVYPDGEVNEEALSEIYPKGNLTLARTFGDEREVMVTKEGIHDSW